MTTYVYDKKLDKVVPKAERERARHHNIVSDIQPYKSMIDGRMITSRSEHRTHLRDNNCIEVGNEKMETTYTKPNRDARRRLLTQIVSNRFTDRQANRIMNDLRETYRFRREPR